VFTPGEKKKNKTGKFASEEEAEVGVVITGHYLHSYSEKHLLCIRWSATFSFWM